MQENRHALDTRIGEIQTRLLNLFTQVKENKACNCKETKGLMIKIP